MEPMDDRRRHVPAHLSGGWGGCFLLFLGLVSMPLGACGGASSGEASAGPPPGPVSVALVPIASGLAPPTFLTHAGDGSGRLFVVLQTGQIRIIDSGGTLLPTPFLDLSASLVALDGTFDERGLLGLAFHPDFATNGRFYVRYSAPRAGSMADPCFGTPRGCHTAVLSEFQVNGPPATTNVADAGSERVLFTVDEPEFNHNAGSLVFGPDGHLYFGLGDGGGAHDGLAQNPPVHGLLGNGQDITTPLGAILRIDVNSTPPMGQGYVVPPTNPFVGVTGVDEIFAYGLRNPYRFSFDDAVGGTGKLLCGDVGQGLFEELNDIVLGGNYGWAVREAFACFDPLAPDTPPASCPSTGPSGEPLLDPVLAYGHDVGVSIVGGYVYRGAGVPDLAGQYVFGDWASDFGTPKGRLMVCTIDGPHAWLRRDVLIAPAGTTDLPGALLAIGRGEDGALYVCTSGVISPLGSAGAVHRIVAAP